MQVPRLYTDQPLAEDQQLCLNEAESHYLLRVLRMKQGRQLLVFNGQGGEYQAELIAQERRSAVLKIQSFVNTNNQSPLQIHLIQGISRGERMDFAIQKAVELGVASITPVFTERCNVKLDENRMKNRLQHWEKIMISACEQSGRCKLVEVHQPLGLNEWLTKPILPGFVCGLDECDTISHYTTHSYKALSIVVGPEGGLTEQEQLMARQQGLLPLSLGPRVLRTETASVVALCLLQLHWGDL